MPNVNGKKYPYTKAGYARQAAAMKAATGSVQKKKKAGKGIKK